MYKEHLVDNN